MALRIPVTPAPPRRRDAFELLLESHERIRYFTELALKVVRPPAMPLVERREALERVERFFTSGLSQHFEDEEVLLVHRVWAARPSTRALLALEDMSRHHRDIECFLESLLPSWRLLRESPERHAELADALLPDTIRFAALMEAHLEVEERIVFPEARASLPAESLASLGTEMRARHGAWR